jgi:hypothetical protein
MMMIDRKTAQMSVFLIALMLVAAASRSVFGRGSKLEQSGPQG